MIEYAADVNESLVPLRKLFPRYACLRRPAGGSGPRVRRQDPSAHAEARRRSLHRRRSGASSPAISPADALRIAETSQPLEIHRAAAGTGIDLGLFDQGFWFNEGSDDEYTEKPKGGKAETRHGYADAAKPMVDMFAEFSPQIFLTSGHATWRDWQIGYPPHQPRAVSLQGRRALRRRSVGQRLPLRSPNPKVYLPAGNCLMGLIHDKQSMALAWLGSGGADQMIGYVVSTWYGRGGWGTRDYFFSEPGRYTLSEAFYFNNQSIVYELQSRFPKRPMSNSTNGTSRPIPASWAGWWPNSAIARTNRS